MTIPIKKLLDTVLNRSDNWQLYLLSNWTNIIGTLHTRVRLEKIDRDMLILGVYESAWLQELHILSSVLIKSINQKLGTSHVKQLRFRLVAPNEKKILKQKISKEKKIIRESFSRQEQTALEAIKDKDLQFLLKSFLLRCDQEQ